MAAGLYTAACVSKAREAADVQYNWQAEAAQGVDRVVLTYCTVASRFSWTPVPRLWPNSGISSVCILLTCICSGSALDLAFPHRRSCQLVCSCRSPGIGAEHRVKSKHWRRNADACCQNHWAENSRRNSKLQEILRYFLYKKSTWALTKMLVQHLCRVKFPRTPNIRSQNSSPRIISSLSLSAQYV